MESNKIYDLCIIGGGINGVGIAADATSRGLSVYLCEQDDLANHTSSASSKMIHGGLRYLEYYEFRLVREALAEREVLLKIAPHLVEPLALVIPHNQLQRPAWLIRLGLFLYDHLGWRFGKKPQLPRSFGIKAKNNKAYFQPLKKDLKKGFVYYDCKVDDARLVILNAKAAESRGAEIHTRMQFVGAKRKTDHWEVSLQNLKTKETHSLHSRTLVNAAGPWVDKILHDKLHLQSQSHVELVKGSHIVLPKLYEGDHAYLLQHTDKRVIFVIPYYQHFTMVGTTDLAYQGDPAKVKIDPAEEDYLCKIVNNYFKTSITPEAILNSWSGVRPLQAEEKKNVSAVTRDYHLELNTEQNQAALLSIFGGKITTYRKLAEQALEQLRPFFPSLKASQTAQLRLPGGDFEKANSTQYSLQLKQDYPHLPIELLTRYAHQYGTLCHLFLTGKTQLKDLGKNFGHNLYEAEVLYLMNSEWADNAESIVWRRTKLGLYFSPSEIESLNNYIQQNNLFN